MSNTNNLTDYVLMPGPDYQDMCNAIREKTGITGDIISSQIGNIIRSIQGSVVLPTHTVNFYNDTTLLQSYANVVYGSTVIYTGETPAKASTATMSYTFDRFEPSGARITGDTNCYAQFIENVVEPDEPETTGEWVPFCADGVTWMGEQVTEAKINTKPVTITDVVLSETNQYRLTVDGTEYICIRNEENDGYSISCDGCPVTINYGESLEGWYFDDGNSDTRFSGTLKVESWTGSEPYAPEEEGYVPTDGYQAFTTDGTWTGEEVTTAGATDWSSSDLRWVGDTSTTIEEGMNILVTVNGVQYNCSVTSAGRPKARYVIASDGCPVTIEGGCDFTAYWAVFPTAGTYTLKVEVPTDSQEVDCATFIPFADLTITSGSLLNFQVSWGERPYEEFEGYLDGNADIAAYSYYDGRARGYVVRLINNGDADLTVSSDVTYTIIITNVIVE